MGAESCAERVLFTELEPEALSLVASLASPSSSLQKVNEEISETPKA